MSFLPVDPTWPNTYRCQDSSGHMVLTDSPAQLEHCELLSNEQAPAQRPAFSQPPTARPSNPPLPNTEPGREEIEGKEYEEEFAYEENGHSEKDKTGTVTVPVQRYGGSLVVPVNLNNQKSVHLILDTGATMTVLSTNVAIELGLTSDSESQVATVNTAGGPVQVNLTRVKSMGVNGAKAKNVVVAIHDLPDVQPGIDGLLGLSFLNNFLVTLDSNQGQLQLRHRP
ncbi:MAG: clan AA aspartic protease [Nitrospirota bacterium]|nr:MAG: clan AA aspartic protease [Nitrospirota bacterium]